jgi:uncharacterized protein (DUF427 family)
VPVNHIEPVPRRVRAVLAGVTVLDTLRARYVWEWPPYPQFYIPLADVAPGVLLDEDHAQRLSRGTARRHALQVDDVRRPAAARVYGADALPGLADHVRFEWDALDAWYEEDEQVYVHPRSPYARVDALRSSRPVRIEVDGVVLAEAASSVVVFETGLPPRHYLDRTALRTEHLEPSATVTACPYKGTTGGYWSALVGGQLHADLAWSYTFPTRELLPIAGLVAFYNERVDLFVDGVLQPRPRTPLSPKRT